MFVPSTVALTHVQLGRHEADLLSQAEYHDGELNCPIKRKRNVFANPC